MSTSVAQKSAVESLKAQLARGSSEVAALDTAKDLNVKVSEPRRSYDSRIIRRGEVVFSVNPGVDVLEEAHRLAGPQYDIIAIMDGVEMIYEPSIPRFTPEFSQGDFNGYFGLL